MRAPRPRRVPSLSGRLRTDGDDCRLASRNDPVTLEPALRRQVARLDRYALNFASSTVKIYWRLRVFS